jgi:poly(A) polymerase
MGRMPEGRSEEPGAAPPPHGPDEREAVRRRGAIPPALLDEHAVTVVRRLQRHGHEAYLVGGCVRDLIAGLEPKDFDVATDAHPGRIKRLFRNARIIGRRFRLAHIVFGGSGPGGHVVETSTFRAAPPPGEAPDAEGPGDLRPDENVFGTAPEDARRRDFTINGLFYDPVADEILDFVGGLADLEARVVRSIGDPAVRLVEDPVRVIRAAHFAERLGFTLEPSLERAIRERGARLAAASQARLYVELLKVLGRGFARATLRRLHDLGALAAWLPEMREVFETPPTWPEAGGGGHEEASRGEPADAPVGHATWNLLGAADRHGLAAHAASEALSLACLLTPWVLEAWRRSGGRGFGAFLDRSEEQLRPLVTRMSIPRRVSGQVREMAWLLLQMREPPRGRAGGRVVSRRAFPDALALLRLDLASRDAPSDLADQWEAEAEGAGVRRDEPRRESRGTREDGGRRRRGGRRRGGRRRRERPGGVEAEAAAWTPAPEDDPA